MNQLAVEWLYDQIENKGKCIYEVIEQAKEMEKQEKLECFIEGYKQRAEGSNLIFDNSSRTYAIFLFNETFKSE